jgi:predicted nucleic acid-binding protein
MKIVVDSNIIFSAILASQSNIGQLILFGSKYFDYYSVDLLKQEIYRHKDKIQQITGYSDSQFLTIYNLLIAKIHFIDDIIIPDKDLNTAITLVSKIDADDVMFVALSNYLHCNLWTGDKHLIKGLKKEGFTRIISTKDLYETFLLKQIK